MRITDTGTPQHYLVADNKGKVATIEFLKGKMVVHTGNSLPYPVLANSTYEASLQSMKTSSSKTEGPGFQANSGDRFTKACTMVKQYSNASITKPIVEYSFDILGNVSQGSFTKWSIVYDITNKRIHFKTAGYQQLKTFDLGVFDFSCTSKPLAFNMNQKGGGNINKQFADYLNNVNRMMMKAAFEESKQQVNINTALQEAAADLADAVTCKK